MTKPHAKLTVREVMPLVQHLYGLPMGGAGGSLHIVLDDGNIEDDHVRFCQQNAADKHDALGYALATILLAMSETQRRKLTGWSNRGQYPQDIWFEHVPEGYDQTPL